MTFWNAVVIIVAIIAFANIRMAKYRALGGHHHRGAMPDLPHASAREAELEREVEALRDRIQVLERIATDERHSRSIAAEIESLRDR